MKHIRIAGKRIQTVELMFYLFASVLSLLAYAVAAKLRGAGTPSLFSAYDANAADAALMVGALSVSKILMRVYERTTAASFLRYAQLALTACALFFLFMLMLFYFQPNTRIPISMVIVFLGLDLALGAALLPVHYFMRRSGAVQRAIGVVGGGGLAETLTHHRLSRLSQKANYWDVDAADLARALEGADASGDKVPFDEIILDRAGLKGFLDWSVLLKARDQGMLIQTPDAFVESEFGETFLKEETAFDVIVASTSNWNQMRRAVKRLFDLGAGAVLTLALAPFAALAAWAIWAEDKGPIFYTQERVGLNGRVFRILKLRSMVVDAEAPGEAKWAETGDPRVTRVGRFIRRTRIDEIPQLLNVLKGEMSLVGPRPERPQFVAELAASIPLYQLRHLVKPGVTGWAQVRYAYGASENDAKVKLQYDLFYVKHYSMMLDVLTLLLTPRIVLSADGAR